MQPIQILHKMLSDGASICTDSRKTRPGAIFFALRGESFNGNRFASAALHNGCQLAVIDDPLEEAGGKFLLVDSVLETLQELSTYHRGLFNIPVLGITGSNGKTTTKELIQAVLSKRFLTQATSGNLNNHIGVPLTLLSLKDPIDMAVVEMGANHMGEIERLCQLARPTAGIITNIGKAHLEGFGSIENIASAKSELYRFIARHKGLLFVNGDNPLLCRLAGDTRRVTYGKEPENHCSGSITKGFPYLEISFRVNRGFEKISPGTSGKISTRLTGAYNFENIMAAITIGLYYGVPPDAIASAIEEYEPGNHRSQVIHTNHNTVIMDAYNANPTSMRAALENFAGFRGKKTALLLGDMLELGEAAEKEHREIVRQAIRGGHSLAIFVGPLFSGVAPDKTGERGETPIKCFSHVEKAADYLASNPLSGFTILVKGSRGIKMEQIIQYL